MSILFNTPVYNISISFKCLFISFTNSMFIFLLKLVDLRMSRTPCPENCTLKYLHAYLFIFFCHNLAALNYFTKTLALFSSLIITNHEQLSTQFFLSRFVLPNTKNNLSVSYCHSRQQLHRTFQHLMFGELFKWPALPFHYMQLELLASCRIYTGPFLFFKELTTIIPNILKLNLYL